MSRLLGAELDRTPHRHLGTKIFAPAPDKIEPLTFSIPHRGLVLFPVPLVTMSNEPRAGQSRSHLTITPSPPLPSPGEPQPSRGPAPLISGQDLKKPRRCSGLSPWSLWNLHGTVEVTPGVAQGHSTHQAEKPEPQLSPDWSPAPALHPQLPDPFACQLVCLKGFLCWLQGGVPRQRRCGSLVRPTFSTQAQASLWTPRLAGPWKQPSWAAMTQAGK